MTKAEKIEKIVSNIEKLIEQKMVYDEALAKIHMEVLRRGEVDEVYLDDILQDYGFSPEGEITF